MRNTASSLLGVGLLLFGLTLMAAWLLGVSPWFAAAGGGPTLFNAAVCFALTGAALATEFFLRDETLRRAQTGLAAAVALLAGLIFIERVFDVDLGIDLPDLHRAVQEDSAHPGRVAPPTALAFLIVATVLIGMHRVRGIARSLVVQGATIAVFLIGLIGFGGRAIGLPLMYPESAFAGMALFTAIGLIVTSLALGLAWRRMAWYEARTLTRNEEQRIILAGSAVLALIVCVAVLSGFAIMARQLEGAARSGLLESLKSQLELFRTTLEHRITRAEMIGARPYIVDQLAALQPDSPDARAFGNLRTEAESALRLGFTAVAFYGLHGEPGGAAGSPVEQPALVLPIDRTRRAALLWDDDFVLYVRIPVERDGGPVGVLVAEQRLASLTKALRAADDFAETAEIRVCKRIAADVECVRQSPQPVVLRFEYSPSLPVARAFAGATEVVIGRDDRRHLVMAAVGPVGNTGLAMVLKLDTVELYAPLRRQLYIAFALMAGMIALGAWLLRERIAPLIRRLERSEERLALALDGARLALWDLDVRTGKVWLDSQWAQMLEAGSSPTQVTSQELLDLVHPDDIASLRAHLAEVLQGKAAHYDIEHRVRKRSGDWLWIHSRGKVIERDAAGRAVRLAGINTDIDLRKQLELRLAHQAGHDALTGLPNRNLFHDRIEQAIARSRRYRGLMAVMYLDIDKFKGINDTYGHDVGDALIRAFARRLVECIRNTDTAARLGGDEFAVILEELEDTAVGRRVAEKIVAAMREEFMLGERRLAVSTSLGVSFYRGTDEIEAEAIIKQADRALYEAKAAGRNTYRVAAEEAA
jgi:diguanylate cyclase (GGDEF)-like protein/PAS domain S-box-containing protein